MFSYDLVLGEIQDSAKRLLVVVYSFVPCCSAFCACPSGSVLNSSTRERLVNPITLLWDFVYVPKGLNTGERLRATSFILVYLYAVGL